MGLLSFVSETILMSTSLTPMELHKTLSWQISLTQKTALCFFNAKNYTPVVATLVSSETVQTIFSQWSQCFIRKSEKLLWGLQLAQNTQCSFYQLGKGSFSRDSQNLGVVLCPPPGSVFVNFFRNCLLSPLLADGIKRCSLTLRFIFVKWPVVNLINYRQRPKKTLTYSDSKKFHWSIQSVITVHWKSRMFTSK